ncbi:MAG: regulator of sirC expression with transglutaminase-like and TPR domain [Alphaproteobacteria bacterium]|jgi:regulator of sirC expression with transglutaminase-like and TPR domain
MTGQVQKIDDAGLRGAAHNTLAAIGRTPSAPFNIAEAALLLAALDRSGVALERYRLHLADLATGVADTAQSTRSAAGQVQALVRVIHGTEGYRGDVLTYDDLQNANLMRVIDRRQGLPVALGVLYLHAARAQGWAAQGLAFPGHFLISVEAGTERIIFDPFAGQPIKDASALRAMIKAVSGNGAELTPQCYAPLGDRHILLRLQNNIKTRLAAQGQFKEAIDVTERMLLIVPEECALHRDLGVYHAEAGNLKAAIESLNIFIGITQDEEARHITSALVQKIQAHLN